jgi:hypothetical protein
LSVDVRQERQAVDVLEPPEQFAPVLSSSVRLSVFVAAEMQEGLPAVSESRS